MSSFDANSVLTRFLDADLSPDVNAELGFAYFLDCEVRENRDPAEAFRSTLRAHLDTGEVTVAEWDPVG